MSEDVRKVPADNRNSIPAHDHELPGNQIERLIAAFEKDYEWLLSRLTAKLKSRDNAVEALHDAYLKLKAGPAVSEIRSARRYLYRMAINIAKNRQRLDKRAILIDEVEVIKLPDIAPDPERTAVANDEMSCALSALHSLPVKRRAIFLARWRDEKSQAEIALEFGLHKRSVQKELSKAEAYLRRVLRRPRHPRL